jgi:hypothetical protein
MDSERTRKPTRRLYMAGGIVMAGVPAGSQSRTDTHAASGGMGSEGNIITPVKERAAMLFALTILPRAQGFRVTAARQR